MTSDALLSRYDSQLRGPAEFASADSVHRDGPVLIGRYGGGRAHIVHEAGGLDRLGATEVRDRVHRAVELCRAWGCDRIEWKTRGHDRVMPVLHHALLAAELTPGEPESVMIGRAEDLLRDARTPPGVTVRRITDEDDVRAMSAMTDEAFGDPPSSSYADALLHRMSRDGDTMELWVAEVDGEMVCGARLEPVEGTEFAGLWGGATRGDQRGRGIYRALVAARARSALERGFTWLHSDSLESSRPILARAGLRTITTTTPYTWQR